MAERNDSHLLDGGDSVGMTDNQYKGMLLDQLEDWQEILDLAIAAGNTEIQKKAEKQTDTTWPVAYERLRRIVMNEKVLRHKEICDGLNELYARKNHDYGDSFHTTFVEEGLAMARIRLGDKFSRFKTLSRLSCNDRDQQQVTDESIRDTLLDLANYAIMTVLEMDTPDESHATLYAYDKPIYTVGEDK